MKGVIYENTHIDDREMYECLPEELQQLLTDVNGFIAFNGGIHVRGCCHTPAWHSLREAWLGNTAFYKVYESITEKDIPFAQDCVGDQFLWREGKIMKLYAETGETDLSEWNLREFLQAIEQNPLDVLGLHTLIEFENEGGQLEPGTLLNVYPPFCSEEAAEGVALRAVPAEERLEWLAGLYSKLKSR